MIPLKATDVMKAAIESTDALVKKKVRLERSIVKDSID